MSRSRDISRRLLVGALGAAAPMWLAGCTSRQRKRPLPSPGRAPSRAELEPLMGDPFLGEAPLDKLIESWLTPCERFYVLNHGDVPHLSASHHSLVIDGAVEKPIRLSMSELLALPRVRAAATLVCAGNRRREHHARKPIADPAHWDAGAVGNAMWSGPLLREVIAMARPKPEARHAVMEGADRVAWKGSTVSFGGSIPLARVLGESRAPALLAVTMNGRPLTRDHGYPVRAVVPGSIGARSIKWLRRIRLSPRPSENIHFTHAHRVIASPDQAPTSAAAIQELPINSAICAPRDGQVLAGEVPLAGYALPSGQDDAVITAVEVSADGGRSWRPARLHGTTRPYCWRLWSTTVRLPRGHHTLLARARDSRGSVQPPQTPWNSGGYLYNAWPRVSVRVG